MTKTKQRTDVLIEIRRIYKYPGTTSYHERPGPGCVPKYALQIVPRTGETPRPFGELFGELIYALHVSTNNRTELLTYIAKNFVPIQDKLCKGELTEKEARIKLRKLGEDLYSRTMQQNAISKKPYLEFLFQTPEDYNSLCST
jgi:hypothetical protein